MKHPNETIILCAAVFAILLCSTGYAWDWKLPAERYKRLNMFERAQYNKAKRLLENKQYRAAASEFEKFKVQFEDSSVLPYVIFMRGLCLHNAKDRHKAIKVYNEVLDYFGEEIDDASAALYYLGLANFDNGDVKDGMAAMKEMVEDEDYRKHPLAAGALRRLANNHWRNNEHELAVKYWKQTVKDFSKTNSGEAKAARTSVTAYYIKNKNCSGYESWVKPGEGDDKRRRWIASHAWDVAYGGFSSVRWRGAWPEYTAFNKKKKIDDMKAFWEYFKSKKGWYEKVNDPWDYHTRAVRFVAHRYGDKKELDAAIEDTLKYIATIKDQEDVDGKYSYLIDRLKEGWKMYQARYLVAKMKNRIWAMWKEYELLGHEGKWKNAEKQLLEIERAGNAKNQKKARSTRARVYKDRLRRYRDAIKLYQEIFEPPGTLWAIQECYYRWGKVNEAITTLTEIENSFPKEAPKAAWCKTDYYHKGGQAKKAIAGARRILKIYPKSGESSKAHQLLEGYGIDTGGGLVDSQE